jgi:Acetyltransferases, including N-acetylases of ribosomal proteins
MKKYIESERIFLRPVLVDDIDAIYSYRSLEEVAKYQYWEPYTRDKAVEFVNQCINQDLQQREEWIGLMITSQKNNNIVGDCAIKVTDNYAEVGCNISPLHQKKGYAKEALALLIDYFFQTTEIKEIIGITDSENKASIRMMESLGMKRCADFEEKVLCKGLWSIEHKYVFHRSDFRN